MQVATIEIIQESKLFNFISGKRFETEGDLLKKINEYQDEINLDNALKSEKVKNKFRELGNMISEKNNRI